MSRFDCHEHAHFPGPLFCPECRGQLLGLKRFLPLMTLKKTTCDFCGLEIKYKMVFGRHVLAGDIDEANTLSGTDDDQTEEVASR